jgi:hypothetical protein
MTIVRLPKFCILAILLGPGCASLQRDVGWDQAARVEAQDCEFTLLSYAGDAQALRARLLIRNLSGRDVLLPAGTDRSTPWIAASSAGHPLSVTPSLPSVGGDGSEALMTRRNLPCSGPITIAAHSSLFVDAEVTLPGSFSPREDSWSLNLVGQWGAGGTVALTLVVPPDHSPDPRGIDQSGRP